MKKRLLEFFKNKFNITLIVLQVVAWICYFLSGLVGLLVIGFFMLEGSFFIVWGVKFLYENRENRNKQQILSELPYTEKERAELVKSSVKSAKNNKLIAITLIILGIVLFFSLFSLL